MTGCFSSIRARTGSVLMNSPTIESAPLDGHAAASPHRRPHDIRRAAVAAQDDGPRRLEARVEGEAVLLRERFERGSDALRQNDLALAVPSRRPREILRIVRDGERYRARVPFEKIAPEAFRGGHVLLLQPIDIGSVRLRRIERRLSSLERRLVYREDLLEDHRDRKEHRE